jgi:hypothetical protein
MQNRNPWVDGKPTDPFFALIGAGVFAVLVLLALLLIG